MYSLRKNMFCLFFNVFTCFNIKLWSNILNAFLSFCIPSYNVNSIIFFKGIDFIAYKAFVFLERTKHTKPKLPLPNKRIFSKSSNSTDSSSKLILFFKNVKIDGFSFKTYFS